MIGLLALDPSAFHWQYVLPGAIALIGIALMLYERVRALWRVKPQTPRTLFQELCAAHNLSRNERRIMDLVAESFPEGARCRAFVDPRPLDQLAASGSADAALSARLRKKLF